MEIIERHLAPFERVKARSWKQKRDDAYKLSVAPGSPFTNLTYGGPGDREALSKMEKALTQLQGQIDKLSTPLRIILESKLRKELGEIETPDWLTVHFELSSSRLLHLLQEALKSTVEMEALVDDVGRANDRAARIVEGCERLWRERTREEPPRSVDAHTDREKASDARNQRLDPKSAFKPFVEEVFAAFGIDQHVATAQRRLREIKPAPN